MTHSLPKELPQPAIRALLSENITTLDDISNHSQADLLKLHGFGPKSIRIIKELMSNEIEKYESSIFLR